MSVIATVQIHDAIWGGRRYGGTVAREIVAAEADWFVYDIHAVLDALK